MKIALPIIVLPALLAITLSGCYPTSLVDQQKDMNAAKGEGDALSIGKV